MPSAQRIRR
jgi:hypothetical protein